MSIKKKKYSEELEGKFGRLTFGDLLKALRESEEMTQASFAKKLKCSSQTLCDLEKGRRIPTPSRAAKIAKNLGYPVKVMIEIALRDSLIAEGLKYKVKLESA